MDKPMTPDERALRDRYAGELMAAMINAGSLLELEEHLGRQQAKTAFAIANSMIVARREMDE